MSSVAKRLVTLAGICLLNACGPANPDVTTEDNSPTVAAASVAVDRTVNSPPRITSAPVTEIIPGLPYLYQPAASEPEGDTLTWSLPQAPSGMQIDTSTGLIVGEALPAGKHAVSLQVADSAGGVDEQNFIIDLASGPEILSTPAQYTYTDTTYQYQMEVFDASRSGLQYAIHNGPSGMQIDQDGLLEWMADQEGQHDVQLTVTDATGGRAEQSFVLTVLAPEDIVIVSTPVTRSWLSMPYEYSLAVIDASGTVNYSFNSAPAGMTIDAEGEIRWTPIGEGSYQVRITATNAAGRSAVQEFVIEVSSFEKIDAVIDEMLEQLFASLSSGNLDGVMTLMTSEAQQRLGPVLAGLADPVLAGMQYSRPVRVSVDTNSAEYMVRRTSAEGEQVFMITFVRDQNQQWKIDDL